jgi:NTE family protein
LCSDAPLRQLVSRHLPFERLEEAAIPLHVVTTDVLSGEEVLLSHGNTVDAVVASAAIPAVFPEAEIDGRYLVDGGIADNAAISQAVNLGADRIYVLPSGYTCALDRPPTSPLGAALQALTLLIEQRLIQEAARYATEVDLRVLPPLCPLHTASTDFSKAAELIERARRATERWLDEGGDTLPRPERFLSLHGHSTTPRPQSARPAEEPQP